METQFTWGHTAGEQQVNLASDLLRAGPRCPLETPKDPLLTHLVLACLSFFTRVWNESDAHLSVHMLYFFSMEA